MAEVSIHWRQDGATWFGEAKPVRCDLIMITPREPRGYRLGVYHFGEAVRLEEHDDLDKAKEAAIPIVKLLAIRRSG